MAKRRQHDEDAWRTAKKVCRLNARQLGSDELSDALHGRGAFRMFKSAIRRLGIEEEWYHFRDSAFEEIAKDWLEANGIEYE